MQAQGLLAPQVVVPGLLCPLAPTPGSRDRLIARGFPAPLVPTRAGDRQAGQDPGAVHQLDAPDRPDGTAFRGRPCVRQDSSACPCHPYSRPRNSLSLRWLFVVLHACPLVVCGLYAACVVVPMCTPGGAYVGVVGHRAVPCYHRRLPFRCLPRCACGRLQVAPAWCVASQRVRTMGPSEQAPSWSG